MSFPRSMAISVYDPAGISAQLASRGVNTFTGAQTLAAGSRTAPSLLISGIANHGWCSSGGAWTFVNGSNSTLMKLNSGIILPNDYHFQISPNNSAAGVDTTADLFIGRKAAASLQLGKDAAGIVNQLLTAANRITSDGVGANLTIVPGNGRGGAGGSLILSTFDTQATGVVGNLISRLTIDTNGVFDFNLIVTSGAVVPDATVPIKVGGVDYQLCLKS